MAARNKIVFGIKASPSLSGHQAETSCFRTLTTRYLVDIKFRGKAIHLKGKNVCRKRPIRLAKQPPS
jgi:hypothetical protein